MHDWIKPIADIRQVIWPIHNRIYSYMKLNVTGSKLNSRLDCWIWSRVLKKGEINFSFSVCQIKTICVTSVILIFLDLHISITRLHLLWLLIMIETAIYIHTYTRVGISRNVSVSVVTRNTTFHFHTICELISRNLLYAVSYLNRSIGRKKA